MTSRVSGKFSSIVDLELAVDELQQAIFQSYYRNCKVTVSNSPRLVHWWSKELVDYGDIVESSLMELKRMVIRILIKVPSPSIIKPLGMPKGIHGGSSVMRLGMFLPWPEF